MSSARTTPVPDTHDLVAAARGVVPLLADNAARTESGRAVPEANLKAVEGAGLLLLSTPRRYGGFEAPLSSWVAAYSELARGCASTAWVTSLFAVSNWMVGKFGERAQDDVFGSGAGARTCGVFTPSGTARRTAGGWSVSGRWAWASGSRNANWALLGIPLGDGPGDLGFGLVPTSELTVEDTWNVVGMAGSGSNTLVGHEVFVPDHRVMSAVELMTGQLATPFTDELLYRAPVMSLSSIAIAAPQLGVARAALDYVIDRAPTRGISYTTYDVQSAAPSFQLAVGDAATAIAVAEAAVFGAAEEVTRAVAAGRDLDLPARTRIRAVTSHAVRAGAETVGRLITAHGASGFAASSPLQRMWRDAAVISRHAFYVYDTAIELHGKVLLGRTDLPTALV